MSTPERTDDPGEHGYGAAKQEPRNEPEGDTTSDDERDEAEPNPSRRERETE